MTKKDHLPQKNALGSYEINIDDVSSDDVLADFEKAFKELDEEAKNLTSGKRVQSNQHQNEQSRHTEDSNKEYNLNIRYNLQDHIDLNQPGAKEPVAPKKSTDSSTTPNWMQTTQAPALRSTDKPIASSQALPNSTPVRLAATKRLPPKPSNKPHTKEQMLEDLQDIMMAINSGSNELQKFQVGHPYLIAPNIYGVWSDSLKETSISLMREYQRLRNKDIG